MQAAQRGPEADRNLSIIEAEQASAQTADQHPRLPSGIEVSMAGKGEVPHAKVKPAKTHSIRTSRRTARFHEEPDHANAGELVRPVPPGTRKRKAEEKERGAA